MTYEKYVELLGKEITAKTMPSAKVVMTVQELGQINLYESGKPPKCPRCGKNVFSQFNPKRVVHDVGACARL